MTRWLKGERAFTFLDEKTYTFPSKVEHSAAAILNQWARIKAEYERKQTAENNSPLFPDVPPLLTEISPAQLIETAKGKKPRYAVTIKLPKIGTQARFTYRYILDDVTPSLRNLPCAIVIGLPATNIAKDLVFPSSSGDSLSERISSKRENNSEELVAYALPQDEKKNTIFTSKKCTVSPCLPVASWNSNPQQWEAVENSSVEEGVIFQRRNPEKSVGTEIQKGVSTETEVQLGISAETEEKASVALMIYAGQNLKEFMQKKKPYHTKMIAIARGCCEEVQKVHDRGYGVNDLSLGNIVFDDRNNKVSIIDPEHISPFDRDVRVHTPGFAQFITVRTVSKEPYYFPLSSSPSTAENKDEEIEEESKSANWYMEKSSPERDVLALGRVFLKLYKHNPHKKKNEHLNCLGCLMAREEIKKRLSLKQALFWLELAERCPVLMNSISGYFLKKCRDDKNASESYKDEIRNILSYLYQTIEINQIDIVQLEAIACLFKLPNSIPSNEKFEHCIDKLLAKETGPALSCILAGTTQYLVSNKKQSGEVEGFIRGALETGGVGLEKLQIPSSQPLLTNALSKYSKNYHSYATEKQKEVEIPLSPDQKKLREKLMQYPEYHADLNARVGRLTPLAVKIALKTFQYMETHPGWYGSIKVKSMQRALLNLSVPEYSPQTVVPLGSSEEIDKQVIQLLKNGCKSFLWNSNPHKQGSRADIFKECFEEGRRLEISV